MNHLWVLRIHSSISWPLQQTAAGQTVNGTRSGWCSVGQTPFGTDIPELVLNPLEGPAERLTTGILAPPPPNASLSVMTCSRRADGYGNGCGGVVGGQSSTEPTEGKMATAAKSYCGSIQRYNHSLTFGQLPLPTGCKRPFNRYFPLKSAKNESENLTSKKHLTSLTQQSLNILIPNNHQISSFALGPLVSF